MVDLLMIFLDGIDRHQPPPSDVPVLAEAGALPQERLLQKIAIKLNFWYK